MVQQKLTATTRSVFFALLAFSMLAGSTYAQATVGVYDAAKTATLADVVVIGDSTNDLPLSHFFRGGNNYEVQGPGVNLVQFFKKVDEFDSGEDIKNCR
jgi:hypothetical protein